MLTLPYTTKQLMRKCIWTPKIHTYKIQENTFSGVIWLSSVDWPWWFVYVHLLLNHSRDKQVGSQLSCIFSLLPKHIFTCNKNRSMLHLVKPTQNMSIIYISKYIFFTDPSLSFIQAPYNIMCSKTFNPSAFHWIMDPTPCWIIPRVPSFLSPPGWHMFRYV